jgi:hypothetical protein
MRAFGLCAARLCVSAWVGAAVLFVAVGVREVTFPSFSSEIKDQLAALRFPLYYLCGATLVLGAWLGTCVAGGHPQLSRGRRWVVLGLLTLALTEMAVDYLWIYRPLEGMVTPPGQVRTEQFVRLHRWSTYVNAANVVWCLTAALVLCWPGNSRGAAAVNASHE